MKKKILLKALIPLTATGISLGTALPLVSCSCSNNENNGDIHIIYNQQQYNDFLVSTLNESVDPTDTEHDWSSNAVDYQPMLDWIKNNFSALSFLLCYLAPVPIIYPFSCEYNVDSQIAAAEGEAMVDGSIAFWNIFVAKETSVFHYAAMLDGNIDNKTCSGFNEAGHNSSGKRKLRPQDLGMSFILSDNIWPGVKFPTPVI